MLLLTIVVAMFVLPVVLGLLGAAVLLCIRPLRFLATYAVVVPIAGSCGAWLFILRTPIRIGFRPGCFGQDMGLAVAGVSCGAYLLIWT